MTKYKMGRQILPQAVAAGLAGICAILAVPVTVLAHADLVRSDPAANSVLQASPSKVALWFTESVDPQLSQIEVLDAANKRWDNGDTAAYQGDPSVLSVSLRTLPNGVYTVTWRNTSTDDGHLSAGSFVFYLGISPAGAPVSAAQAQPLLQSPVEPFLRWLVLLGVLTIMGCLVFEVFVTRSVLTARTAPVSFAKMDVNMERRTLILVLVAAVVCFAASLAELFVKALNVRAILNPMPLSGVIDVVLQTYWGKMWLWRMVMLLAAIIIPGLVLASWSPSRSGQRGWQLVGLGVLGVVLFSLSMVGHDASALTIRPEAAFTDYLHLLAASVWVGGIVYLAVVVPPAMRLYRRELKNAISGPPCPTGHVSALGRFSLLALMSASVLLITGLYSSWAQVGVFRALATPYGIALCVKISLALALAILGAVGLLWVRPRLNEDERSLSVLKSTTTAQAFLAIGIVLSVGFLVSLDPARQALTGQPAISIVPSSRTGTILWVVELLVLPSLLLVVWQLQKRFSRPRRISTPDELTAIAKDGHDR